MVAEGEPLARRSQGRRRDHGVPRGPQRVVHTWHVSTDPDHASEVELRFVALGPSRTRVTLEHRHWERMSGEQAQAVRDGYNQEWEGVFMEKFGQFAGKAEDV